MSTGLTPPSQSPVVDDRRLMTLAWLKFMTSVSRLLTDARTIVADVTPGAIAAGAAVQATITSSDIKAGDVLGAGFDGAPGGVMVTANATADGTAIATFLNVSGADVTLPAGKLRLRAVAIE